MNELLQFVWIFIVLIESLNGWLLLIELWVGLEWSWTISAGPQWSPVCWKTLTQSQSDEGDSSQSNPQDCFSHFLYLAGWEYFYTNEHLNIFGSLKLCKKQRNELWAEISTQLEVSFIKVASLLSKWFREIKLSSETCSLSCLARFSCKWASLFVRHFLSSISIAAQISLGTFLQAVCFIWAG